MPAKHWTDKDGNTIAVNQSYISIWNNGLDVTDIRTECWPEIRDFIDKELGVVHSLADKAQQNIEAILNGEEWAAAQRSLED